MEQEVLPQSVATKEYQVSLDAIRKLEELGILRIETKRTYRNPISSTLQVKEKVELTDTQKYVVQSVWEEMEEGNQTPVLIHGVTGSGKTEVFIRLVREVLKLGRAAMILVPEIALTPQMVSWFRVRFGDNAAVLHSGLSQGEKFDEWRRIREGEARVVIGARSAVFAPASDIGIIVVDEEHETTYLSDRHPRYDARDVAAWRCENEGATLLLASATPSMTVSSTVLESSSSGSCGR